MQRTRRPTHPGEILHHEYLEPLGWTQGTLANKLNCDIKTVNRLVNGRTGVKATMALRLSELFDTTPELWLNLQQAYDLFEARQALKAERTDEQSEDVETITERVSRLLERHANERYIVIDNHKYDRALLQRAHHVAGPPTDGRIRRKDVKILLEEIKDDGQYTDLEKDTVRLIRREYSWDKDADTFFRTEIRRWAAERGSKKPKSTPNRLKERIE